MFYLSVELMEKPPNFVYWYNGPKYAEYFFKFITSAEQQHWYFWKTSAFGWCVINGLIRIYHTVRK